MFSKLKLTLDRIVGLESQKTYADKVSSGFFDRYLSGEHVLDVGFAGHAGTGQPIVPQAIGVDKDFPGYDGTRLPFPDGSQDAVYSSHCFEHVSDHIAVLQDWHRVLRVGGYMVIVVPHQYLFEKRFSLPSRWNADHKRFLTPAKLLAAVEEALPANAYRIRHMCDNDKGYDYSIEADKPATGCFEIELVLEKIEQPSWVLLEDAVRDYGPNDFHSRSPHVGGWRFESDLAHPQDGCWVWGPYINLPRGRYRVRFALELFGLDKGALETQIHVDVGCDYGGHVSGASSFIGQQGVDAIRHGDVFVDFDNPTDGAVHEFRVYTFGGPTNSILRFYGVSLESRGAL